MTLQACAYACACRKLLVALCFPYTISEALSLWRCVCPLLHQGPTYLAFLALSFDIGGRVKCDMQDGLLVDLALAAIPDCHGAYQVRSCTVLPLLLHWGCLSLREPAENESFVQRYTEMSCRQLIGLSF
ncbi:hypothetical protein V8C44DRAFT_321942 [Trichoderma aethiopicum]